MLLFQIASGTIYVVLFEKKISSDQILMCILGVAIDAHADLPFLLVHNREERLDRATQDPHGLTELFLERTPADVFPPEPCACVYCIAEPNIVCARDLERGGSWLGLGTSGALRIVALTNLRRPPSQAKFSTSRGALVSRWLAAHPIVAGDAEVPPPRIDLGDDYDGFSALVSDLAPCDGALAVLISNHDAQSPRCARVQQLSLGVHTWSNGGATLQVPSASAAESDDSWPKCHFLQHALTRIMQSTPRAPSVADECAELAWISALVMRLTSVMCCSHLHGQDESGGAADGHDAARCTECHRCSSGAALTATASAASGGNPARGDDCPLGTASCVHCSHFFNFHSASGAHSDSVLGNTKAESAQTSAAAADHAQQDHRVMFFAHNAHPSWTRGTRSQTIVIRTRRRLMGKDNGEVLDSAGGRVYFLYRNLDRELDHVWKYRRFEIEQ